MSDKVKKVLKYGGGIVGLIFIILCIIAFVILVIPVKEVEDVRMVSNRMPRRVSLAYDTEINGVIVPLVQIFETNGNKIKEVTENSILDITLEEPLKENDEKNPGLIVGFKVQE